MICEACETARRNPLSGLYRSDCPECSARSLADSPFYHEAAQANAITPAYRDALRAFYGAAWRDWHQRVRAWAASRMGSE